MFIRLVLFTLGYMRHWVAPQVKGPIAGLKKHPPIFKIILEIKGGVYTPRHIYCGKAPQRLQKQVGWLKLPL